MKSDSLKTAYQLYLETNHWKEIKQRVYNKYRVCQDCGTTKRLHVHHLTYRDRGHEKLSQLILLCRTCHFRHHRMSKGLTHLTPLDWIQIILNWIQAE